MPFVNRKHFEVLLIMGVIIVSFMAIRAQSFSEIPGGFPSVYMSSSCWGDYDNDGDLDLLMQGFSSQFAAMTRLYRNNSDNSFSEITTNLPNVSDGCVDWGDYDNDGDLDILILGQDNGLGITKVFRNENNDTFTDIQLAAVALFNGKGFWNDFDNDGDLDFIVAGSSVTRNTVSLLYRNDGNDIFSEIDAGITPLWRGSLDWGDYDNDGDADLVMTGTNLSHNPRTKLFRNDGDGNFSDVQGPFFNVTDGQAIWGDYDQDGDLDIILNGSDSSFLDAVSLIYRNNGDGTFTDIQADLAGAGEGAAVSGGDYDNDGDMDFLMIGSMFGGTVLYSNDGNNIFTPDTSSIRDGCCGSIDWVDFDNDRDLDLYISGLMINPSRLYRNETTRSNQPSAQVLALPAEVEGNQVRLRWYRAYDDYTYPAGLTYNIRIGTIPGGVDIVSPMANITTGFRKIVGMGNAFQDTTWVIKNLSPGTYYWAVQSIDNSFQGSLFSQEDSFVVGTSTAPENPDNRPKQYMIASNYPNPFNAMTIIKYTLPEQSSVKLDIFNLTGALVQSSDLGNQPAGENQFVWDAQLWPSGIYYYKFKAGDSKAIGKMVYVK